LKVSRQGDDIGFVTLAQLGQALFGGLFVMESYTHLG
jgi:hypothetical protein